MLSYKPLLPAALATAIAALATVSLAAPAAAQSYPGAPGVADLSLAEGSVVVIRGGTQVAATMNAPLLPGDYLTTGARSRAEVQFNGISMIRLAQDTQVRLVNLTAGTREVLLGTGTIDLAELQGSSGGPRLDTPSLTVRPNRSGDYRVTVLGNGQTLVTVRSGAALVATGAGSQVLTPGSTLVAYGPYANPSLSSEPEVALDAFDRFNESRDGAIAAAFGANPYLTPQLAGYANLADYGAWQNVPGYGYAWAPGNQTNFAPYQNGQWVWEQGYGYTWVPSQQWGYAPAHYGSWFYNQQYGGWLWQPPASQYQATPSALASAWAPAMVAFFLSGEGANAANFANGYNSGNIGWIPLAPGEPYQPWYAQGGYPVTTVTNITNITNVYRYYTNAGYQGGVAMMPVEAWRAGNFRTIEIVRPKIARDIVLVRGGIPVVPTVANLHYSARTVEQPVALAQTFSSERFAAKAPHVASFPAQQAEVAKIASAPKTVAPPAQAPETHPVYRDEPALKAPPAPLTTMRPVEPRPVATPRPIEQPRTVGQQPRTVEQQPRPVVQPARVTPQPHEYAVPQQPAIQAPRPALQAPRPAVTARPVPHEQPQTHAAYPAAKAQTPKPAAPVKDQPKPAERKSPPPTN